MNEDSRPTPQAPDAYPAYAHAERRADAVMHALGLTFAVIGGAILIPFTALFEGGARTAAVSIYCAALLASFLASTLYHFPPRDTLRPLLRRFDYAAIFLKIAGTYTPLVVLIGSAFAYGVLAVVWAVALLGAGLRLFFWRTPGPLGPLLYLGLGWASLALVWSLFPILPLAAALLVVAGGVLYSLGVLFFRMETLRYSMAIWHGFVLAASACFFTAISLGTFLAA